MFDQDLIATTATSLQEELALLREEKALAALNGLGSNELYMTDLEAEIAAVRAAYIGQAVTEIASLRAALSGPQVG